MLRKIIEIDEEKCIGCKACAEACHEGAIGMVNKKAKLLKDNFCDGLGDCLPVCPTGAIKFTIKEAAPYDQDAVNSAKAFNATSLFCGCHGTNSTYIERKPANNEDSDNTNIAVSELLQWPIQIKLVPVTAPFFQNAGLLVAADCTAFARADFHQRFIKGKIALIGCPKLDNIDYSEKLAQILKNNSILDITVVRMEVPCCTGIENAIKSAVLNSKKSIPVQVFTLSRDGRILE